MGYPTLRGTRMATRLEQPRWPSSPIRYWSTRTARDARSRRSCRRGIRSAAPQPNRPTLRLPARVHLPAPWVAPSAGTSPDGSTPPFHPSRRLDWKPRKEASARLRKPSASAGRRGPHTSKTRSSRPRGALGASRSPRSERSWSRKTNASLSPRSSNSRDRQLRRRRDDGRVGLGDSAE
jgi:hypothetical protein